MSVCLACGEINKTMPPPERIARLTAVVRAAQLWRDERVVGAIHGRQRDLVDALAQLQPGDIPEDEA